MRLLSSFKNLRLYRNKTVVLDTPNPKQLRYGNLITVVADTVDETCDILKAKMFDMRYTKSFYTDKRIRIKAITGAVSTIMQKPSEIFNEVKTKLPSMSFYYLKASQYQKRNLVYDASAKFSALSKLNLPTKTHYINQVNAMLDSMHTDERFSDYKKRYYIIPIDGKIKVDVKYLQRTRIQYIQQAFFYRLFNDPTSLTPYIGSTFIVYGVTGLFTYFTLTAELIQESLGIADELQALEIRMENGDSIAEEDASMTLKRSALFRFMKLMSSYAMSDIAGMKEGADLIEPDTDDEVEEGDSDTELKVSKITSKLTKNKFISKGEIADNLVKSISSKTGKKSSKTELLSAADESPEEKNVESAVRDALTSLNYAIDATPQASGAKKKPEGKPKRVIVNKAPETEEDEKFNDELEKLDEGIEGAIEDPDSADDEFKDLYGKAIKAAEKAETPRLTPAQQRRVDALKKKFDNITLDDGTSKNKGGGKSFKEIVEDFERIQIEQKEFPVKNVNKSISCSTVQDMTRQYNEKMLDATIVSIVKFFQEAPELKLMVTHAKKEDISDPFNAMWRYHFQFEDEYGKKHSVTYNVPKLVNNKFFYVNGSKKMLKNQLVNIPIIKTKPYEVRFQTAHNQMTIQRFGRAFSPKLEILKKLLRQLPNDGSVGVWYKLGNSSVTNGKFDTVLEYDDLASEIYSMKIMSKDKKNEIDFFFNQADIRIKMEDLDIAYVDDKNRLPVGIVKTPDGKYIPLELDLESGKDADTKKLTLSEIIINALSQYAYIPDFESRFAKLSAPSRYMYSRMEYISRKVAVGLFLGMEFGLSALLKSMKVDGLQYEVWDEKKRGEADEKHSQNYIKFKDKFLYYGVTPIRHALILNGISREIQCENFDMDDFDTKEPYLIACDEMFGTRQMEKGYDACKQFMLDPTDKMVLEKLGLPTEFLEVMLYASSLLDNNHVSDPKKIENLRLRKLELIPVFMYKSMVQSYNQFRYHYAKDGKFSSKSNDILKKMAESQLFNDYDTLNPIREVESEAEATFKGPGGCRVEDAYTLSRRAYDKSMVGICAVSGPDGPGIGINKYLSMNPRVTNLLGFMKSGEDSDAKEIDYGNIGSLAELTAPFAINHDDARRLSFVAKESKHIVAAKDTDPLLIGNGVEKVFPRMVSDDFITSAKDDGKVLKVDKDLGIAIVEYKNGEVESIDIKDRQQKDGGMGIYVVGKKQFDLSEGDSFKKHDVLARNPSYFSTINGAGSPQYNPGTLARVAILMSAMTFEDSSIVSERLAGRMSADVVIKKTAMFGAKSRIVGISKIGDYVNTGDSLFTYQNELDSDEINTLVGSADNTNFDELDEIINTRIKSKVSGYVHDIRVYYTVKEEDMSETVKGLVTAYNARIQKRNRLISKFDAKPIDAIGDDYVGISRPSSGDKVNGEYCPVGNILVEIYVRYTDSITSGDKVCFYASMKSIVQRVLPETKQPYPVGKNEDKIDALLSPISVNARMVSSILAALYGNKLVYGLKEKIRDLYTKYAKNELK